MLLRTANRQKGWIAAFTLLSWLGEYVHNFYELPQLTLLSPENSGTALVAVLRYAVWWRFPASLFAAVLLQAWALLHLIGGAIVSVLPLGVLPFAPEQSRDHYAAHVVYDLAQLPLLAAMGLRVVRNQPSLPTHGRAIQKETFP